MIDIEDANLADLLSQFIDRAPVKRAVRIVRHATSKSRQQKLARLLRDYSYEDPIEDEVEVSSRDDFDELLDGLGVLEIGAIARMITLDRSANRRVTNLLHILQEPALITFYESYYPQLLPQSFRLRLEKFHSLQEKPSPLLQALFFDFVSIHLIFKKRIADSIFLRFCDGFAIDGYDFDDLVDVLKSPQDFSDRLLIPRYRQDTLDKAVSGFAAFLQFAQRLENLLDQCREFPLLRSAIWHQYGYWFDILADELSRKFDRIFERFQTWASKTAVASDVEKEAFDQMNSQLDSLAATMQSLWRSENGRYLQQSLTRLLNNERPH